MANRSTTPHNAGYTIAHRVDGSGTNGVRINVWVEYAVGTPNHSNHTVPLTAYFYADLKDGYTSSTSSTSGTSSSFSVNGIAGSGHSGGCDFTVVGRVNQWGYWSGNIGFSSNGTVNVAFSGSATTHSSWIKGGSISGTIPVSYYLSFNINYLPGSRGCTGSAVTDTQAWGASYTHRGASIFTPPTGYYISGWSLSSDDNTAEYGLGQTHAAGYAFGSSVNLYPTIAPNSYSYNFNVLLPDGSEPYTTGTAGSVECSINGGSYSRIYNEAASSYAYGTTFRFRNFSPGTGMHLSSVTGATQNSDGSWSATMGTGGLNINFYTAWNTYTISYNANGGSSTPSAQTKTYGVALTLRSGITRSNATKTITTTFNGNGGTSPSAVSSTATMPYTFAGWKATNGTVYAAGGSYTANAGTTMTAQWTNGSYTGAAISLPTATRTGYTFNGWYTAATGGTKITSYSPTSNTTLYAQWSANWYVLRIYDELSGASIFRQDIAYDQTITLPELPKNVVYNLLSTSLVAFGGSNQNLYIYGKYIANNYANGSNSYTTSYTHTTANDVNLTLKYAPNGSSMRYEVQAPSGVVTDYEQPRYWQKASGDARLPAIITPGSVAIIDFDGNYTAIPDITGSYTCVYEPRALGRTWVKHNNMYSLGIPLFKIGEQYVRGDAYFIKHDDRWMSLLEYLDNR